MTRLPEVVLSLIPFRFSNISLGLAWQQWSRELGYAPASRDSCLQAFASSRGSRLASGENIALAAAPVGPVST
jgi:hypothetical protein